jgi:thymidylate synthase (FAD)
MYTNSKILDYGELVLLDTMGSDQSIVDAARISYSNNTKVSSTEKLINYLMRHHHWGPFEMGEMLFYIKAPIFVFRQLIRHRTASVNEVSGRYSILTDDVYNPRELRLQSKDNKQGSSNTKVKSEIGSYDVAYTEYLSLINNDVAREQARMVLPLATYSEMYWKCDLRNIFNFLKLRLDQHAQYEIREYAKAMAKLVEQRFPLSYAAFEKYVLNAISLSSLEIEALVNRDISKITGRELDEFKYKLKRLGLDEIVLQPLKK